MHSTFRACKYPSPIWLMADGGGTKKKKKSGTKKKKSASALASARGNSSTSPPTLPTPLDEKIVAAAPQTAAGSADPPRFVETAEEAPAEESLLPPPAATVKEVEQPEKLAPPPLPSPPSPNEPPPSRQKQEEKQSGVRRSAPPVPKKHTLSAPTPSAPKQAWSLRRVLDQHAPSLKIPTPAGVDIVKQTDYLLAGVPSLAAFLAFNFVNKFILRSMLQITFFPPPLIGMFLFYLAMLSMQDSDAEKCVKFFEPAVALLTNFLPVMFSPGLICTPSATVGIGLVDFLKFTLVIGLGMTAVIFQTGTLTDYIMKISKVRGCVMVCGLVIGWVCERGRTIETHVTPQTLSEVAHMYNAHMYNG